MDDIVERFRDNPVVIFPQTAFFEESTLGREYRRRVASSYAKNPNLVFFSRDRVTFETMREVCPATRNLYVPDIVLYLDESQDGCARDGALLCLRQDKERVVDERAAAAIRSALAARDLAVLETSTVVTDPPRVDARNRDAVLDAKWDEFRSAKAVVTDRLHGMIFSAITGTPCVALDNVSRKVSQGYEWIRHIPNIRVARNTDEVPALLDEVLAAGPCRYDRAPLEPYYDRMKEAIRDAIG
jgi:pyruvyl transferase EpsI